jgi:hypothetical protein
MKGVRIFKSLFRTKEFNSQQLLLRWKLHKHSIIDILADHFDDQHYFEGDQ